MEVEELKERIEESKRSRQELQKKATKARKAQIEQQSKELWRSRKLLDGTIKLDYYPHAGQYKALHSKKRFVWIISGTQGGKSLDVSTPIPVYHHSTKKHFVPMGDICIGDVVLDEQCGHSRVTYVSPVYENRKCYTVGFSDSTQVIADAEHLWSVVTSYSKPYPVVITTQDMVTTPAVDGKGNYNYYLGSDERERFVTHVTPTKSVPVKCIEVWSKSGKGLYLCTEDYIPTHNTSFGPLWLFNEIQRCGEGDYLAITATYPLLKLKMLPEFLKLFRDTLNMGTWGASDKVFTSHDGKTRVIFGSAQNSESLESATAKAAWLDECGQDQFKIDSWEAVQRRLSLHRGRALGTTTPYNLGWIKQQVVDKFRAGSEEHDVIQFDSIANPAFPKEEFKRAERELPRWKFLMFYRGILSQPEGMIYSSFKDEYREQGGHLVKPFDIPNRWPRYVGVDFGAINTARITLAKNPDTKEYYIYAENLEGDKTTKAHVKSALEHIERTNIISWHGGSGSEKQYRMDWAAEGIDVRGPSITDVESGILRVIAGFKTNQLFVFDNLAGVRDELGTYGRVMDANGTPTEKIKDKETYHRLDALRYVFQTIFKLADHRDVKIVTVEDRSIWGNVLI